ncbi:hypothetical protein E8E13_006987 [Curvularia kusanoi]|uniref:Uncharacterized protein n=1 Tax=Curvularia kusanoi TaxID=90978 RepID=A0A9P4TBG9_CURKU|nr:hypothetical protein E8E13_006987 [Curvularia kusanoi]
MLFQKLAIAATLTALVAAQEIEQSDIPQQCTQLCAQVVTIARDCDNRFDNDNAETQCICTAPNANNLLPACEACVRQYDTGDDDDDNDRNDNDVRDVLNRCSFTAQSSFNAASASSVVAASNLPTASAATTGSVVVTRTSGTNVATSIVASSQATQNAAPGVTAAAGLGFGAAVLAMGVL